MKRIRTTLMLLAATGLIASLGLFAGLKIGRPAYYSDGEAEVIASELRNAGMLRWSNPQLEFEIPGPVRGRVTELPDGRLIYGRVMSSRATDLFVFNPRHPSDPPQRVIELSSPGHDFSPVLGPGGRLYFASDRPSGSGGFDIYSATYRDGLFFAPRSLPAGINSGLDETDPTIDQGGGQLVFVRRDPDIEDGRNGRLMIASLAAPDASRPVFPEEDATEYRRELTPPVDRDPMLAPDGVGLYFVRRSGDGEIALMRTSWHVDHFVQPMSVRALQVGGPFRGPTLVDDGFGMRLVGSTPVEGEDDVVRSTVFRAEAREVYPFWEGQWWLEWLLLYLVLFFAVILILLTLGARWSSLDFITKLVLLSVLIHLVLLLWLSGVEIVRSYKPRGPDTGSVQVHLISQRAAQGDTGSAASPSQNKADVSESLQFEGHAESMQVDGPEVDVAMDERALESAASAARPRYEPIRKSADPKVKDRAKEIALRGGTSPERAPDARALQTEAETRDRTAADRRRIAAEEIRVVVPGSDPAIAASSPGPDTTVAAAAPRRAIPSPEATTVRAAIADAPDRPRKRVNAGESAGEAARLKAAAAAGLARNPGAKPLPERVVAGDAGDAGVREAAPVPTSLVGSPKRRTTHDAGEIRTPEARDLVAIAPPVADALDVRTKGATPGPSEARLGRSAGAELNQAERRIEVSRRERSAVTVDVAMPQSILPDPAGAAAPIAVVPRDLPRPQDPLAGAVVAIADTVRPAAEPRRLSSAEAMSRVDAADLENIRPDRAESAIARGERTGVVPVSNDVETPGTSLVRVPRRDTAVASRAEGKLEAHEPRPPYLMDAVALRDGAAATSSAPTVETGKPNPLAAADLRSVGNPGTSTAPEAVRGFFGEFPEARKLKTPGSLVELDSRRALATEKIDERRIRSRRDGVLGDVALRDDVLVSRTKTTPVRRSDTPAGTSDRSMRLGLVDLQPRDQGSLFRPEWDHDRFGLHDVSIGLMPPGSFLTRAGVRPEVPIVVAVAEELTPYSNRFGANKLAALKKYGGTEETERAVRSGLAYLARIQNENGIWGDERASQRKYGQVFIGKTGLCLLAFLGAGHTPVSDTKYSEVVRRAVLALLDTQRESGHFGVTTAYSHGITTYALAECYALTKDEKLRQPIERAAKWILANQNVRRDPRNRGGWGYFSSTLRPEDSYSRSSASAWQIMALESARLSGIEVPAESLEMARDYLVSNYDRRHRYFLYNKEPDRLRSEWRTLPASTPAAVFCLQLLGMDATERPLEAGLNYTLDRAPKDYKRYSDDEFVLRGAGNVYFWYYSTLACFMAGGDTWDEWNQSLKKVLLSGQSRDGSFPIIDSYAKYAGDSRRDRSYTTAMCVLSLEVYYRYFTPLLKQGK